MAVHCLACKAAVGTPTAKSSTSQPCPCFELARLYQGDNTLVSCAGGCGRCELFPDFLEVASYLCVACLTLASTRLLERSNPCEQESHPETQSSVESH